MNQSGLIVVTLAIMACACGGNKDSAPAPETVEAVHEPAAAAPAAKVDAPSAVGVAAVPKNAAPSSIEEAGFSLKLAEAGPYKAGELARVVLQIEPRGVFHINQEYPVEITLTGDMQTNFPKANLARGDAAQFDEKKARFEVPFTPAAAGDHKLMANVKFAVCTAENCVPDERDLALAVAVK
jgi:hypothetical protein